MIEGDLSPVGTSNRLATLLGIVDKPEGLVTVIHGDTPGPGLVIHAELNNLADCKSLATATLRLRDLHSSFRGSVKVVFSAGTKGHELLSAAVGPAEWWLASRLNSSMLSNSARIATTSASCTVAEFEITITGKGGHASIPFSTCSPVEAGAATINALQTALMLTTDMRKPQFLRFNSFQSGTTFNVIGGNAKIGGILVAFDQLTCASWEEKMRRVATNTCLAAGASCEVKYSTRSVGVSNSADVVSVVQHQMESKQMEVSLVPVNLVEDSVGWLATGGCGALWNVGYSSAADERIATDLIVETALHFLGI